MVKKPFGFGKNATETTEYLEVAAYPDLRDPNVFIPLHAAGDKTTMGTTFAVCFGDGLICTTVQVIMT